MGDRLYTTRPAPACGLVLRDDPAEAPYQRCVPVVQGPVAASLSAAMWGQFYTPARPPAARVVLLRQATVRGPGVITLPGDVIVQESLINSHLLPGIAGLRRVSAERFLEVGGEGSGSYQEGRHVLLKQLWDTNYGHWLIEGLPRVELLEDVAAAPVLVTGLDGLGAELLPMGEVYAQSLALAGVPAGLVRPTGYEAVTYEELIYPLPLTEQPWLKAPLAIRMLERLGGRVGRGRGPERLFLRRPGGSRRRLREEDALADRLGRAGYSILTPGEMGFADQVAAFSGATHVVGVLGAELANLAFAPAGVRLLGLAPADMADDFFWDLVSHKGGGYFSLHGVGGEDGFSVDGGAFEGLLGVFEGE